MTIAPLPYEIRQIVFRTFCEIGAVVESTHDIRETILIDAGACMARTYHVDGYKALWLLDEGTVQFSDTDGNLLRVVNLNEEMTPVRLAA
jgi:hypothetical protein